MHFPFKTKFLNSTMGPSQTCWWNCHIIIPHSVYAFFWQFLSRRGWSSLCSDEELTITVRICVSWSGWIEHKYWLNKKFIYPIILSRYILVIIISLLQVCYLSLVTWNLGSAETEQSVPSGWSRVLSWVPENNECIKCTECTKCT